MELKYKPVIGVLMLVLGLVNLVLTLLTQSLPGILLGGLITIIGILMLSRPMVDLAPSSIGMRNLLGMELKRHHLTEGNFEVRDNKIFVDGKRKVSLMMFDTDEETVRNYLTGS